MEDSGIETGDLMLSCSSSDYENDSSDYENNELEDNIINPFMYEPEASSSSNSSSHYY